MRILNMVEELKFGQTALYTRDFGRTIKLTDGVDSFTQQEIYMRESGLTTRLMEQEFTSSPMELSMMVNGETMTNMVTA